ncbi:MAG: phage/plasmid replication protein [Sedimentibacter sp.]|uniref:phage/plasmid replication domain-containing protein n=1 Tax=Sedimentibacter sp. TaxID=1960295 RepID=UPI00298160EA|nr:phage/plasmid replication protein [Sedimentibacter sp.]MDW5300683.1 phage/plasmid replication protein [Sedimentibacter sp.]
MIDTVSFLTPKIPQLFVDKIKLKLKLYNCIDCDTGELIYQFSTGSIAGSYDSSINIKINVDNSIKITCSLHKVILGYNIAYGSDNLILLANCLKKILYKAFEVKLPDVMTWELMQIDYTLTFNLGSQENVESYVNSLKNVSYCRREAKHYNNNGLQL